VGAPIVVGFGVLALVGLALVGLGALRRSRLLVAVGAALLLALAGLWMLGLPGAALGAVALGPLLRGRAGGSAVDP
jgi:hypothetical protein